MDKPGIPLPFSGGRHTRQIDSRAPNPLSSKLYAQHMEKCCISIFDNIHRQLRRVVSTIEESVSIEKVLHATEVLHATLPGAKSISFDATRPAVSVYLFSAI
jgi:hypothetical protein